MGDRQEIIKLELQEVAEISSLKRGDHLAVEGMAAKTKTYYHHGIYLATDLQVADFGSDDNHVVRKLDFLQFKGNRRLFKYVYPPGTCIEPETAARLAEEVVDNPELWGPYNLLTNNCEHFATRCKVGKAYSIQVEKMNMMEKTVANSASKCSLQ